MKNTIYNAHIEVLESMTDVRIINKESNELNISNSKEIHFEFIALNNDKLKSNDNKRYTLKANTIVINQLCAKCIEDESVSIDRLYTRTSKNYANIVITRDLQELLQIVRNAHYESLALKIENAIECELVTSVENKRKRNKKAK